MDVELPTVNHRKRKFTKTNLTVSKKSKKYRHNLSMSPFAHEIKEESVGSKSDISPVFISSQESTSSSFSSFSALKKETDLNSCGTQTLIKSKSVGIQSVPVIKHKASQNVDMTTKNSTSVQTRINDIKSEGNNLLFKLVECSDFNKFAENLSNHNQTHKFIKTVQSLIEGKMSFDNIAWKAALDMGYLFSCTSTTRMDYDREWLEFCQVLYHMFGAGVINALRGRGHFSQVTSDKCSKGIYPPIKGEFNFPIPSITTLKKLDIGFPTQIPVGFIQHSLDLAELKSKEGAEFILSFDGKLIAPGCKGDNEGDCDLWGVEGPPNLPTAVRILKKCLGMAKKINVDMALTDVAEHYFHLKELINMSFEKN